MNSYHGPDHCPGHREVPCQAPDHCGEETACVEQPCRWCGVLFCGACGNGDELAECCTECWKATRPLKSAARMARALIGANVGIAA